MEISDLKLILLLQTFNKKEFAQFGDYIISPFFNKSILFIKFYELLKGDYPDFENLNKQLIFKEIYPNEEYKDKKIRDLFSKMNEFALDFIAHEDFNRKFLTKNAYILENLVNRKLTVHYNSKYKESVKLLKSEKIIDEDYIFAEYSYSRTERLYKGLYERKLGEIVISEQIIEEYNYFINYFVYMVLAYALHLNIRRYSGEYKFHLSLLDKVTEFLEEHPRDKYPVISIISRLLKMQADIDNSVEDNSRSYREVIELIEKYSDTINIQNKRYIYVFLFNYTRIKSLGSNQFFKEEHYRILKYSIENNLYPKDGNIFPFNSYVTVAATALVHKDFEWAEEFIEKYKNEVTKDQRENSYTFCKGALNYRKGNLGEALKYLGKVSIDELYFHLRVQNLQIKIHYELGNYEVCKNIIDSYRHFLGSVKEFPEFVRIRFVNYVNITSRLIHIHLGGDKKNIININKDLDNLPAEKVESMTWIRTQLNKLL